MKAVKQSIQGMKTLMVEKKCLAHARAEMSVHFSLLIEVQAGMLMKCE